MTSMKFQRQRNNITPSDIIDIANQQFLTFRNNLTTENTGRSVFSQPFDYRSLQKYHQNDDHEDRFRKNMKNIRSTQKYRQIKEQATTQANKDNGQTQRQEEIKIKIATITKSLKRAYKKQQSLQQQIDQLLVLIQEQADEITRNKNDMEQLADIQRENAINYNEMLINLRAQEQKGKSYQKQLDMLDVSIQGQIKTARSTSYSSDLSKKLTQGMKDLQIWSNQLDYKINYFQENIRKMEIHLAELAQIQDTIRQVTS